MWKLLSWLHPAARNAPRDSFAVGLYAAGQEYQAACQIAGLAATRDALAATAETIKYAKSLGTTDEDLAGIAEVVTKGIINQTTLLRAMMQNPMPKGEEATEEMEEMVAGPFDERTSSSTGTDASQRPSPRSLPKASTISAPTESSSEPEGPPRRKRGRPPKQRPSEIGPPQSRRDGQPHSPRPAEEKATES